ncbi:hypothetical protein [Pendulispora albinea]|uniref:Tetratricopeptide repeat protein n=1 Tax=Pendulispora albinea TaxID=2741071 RepID=A0ABZ2M1Z0_9BACT
MIVRSRPFFFVALCLFLMSPTAHADDDRAATLARRLLKAGVEQYKAGDFEAARMSFTQSFALRATGDALRRLAQAELRTNHPLEALEHFRLYGRDRNADRDFVRDDLPNYIEACHGQLGHLRITASPGDSILVDGRRAMVDDRSTPRFVGEVNLVVVPGERLVTARGKEDQAQRVMVLAGEVVDVVFHKENSASSALPAVQSPVSGPIPAPVQPQKEPTLPPMTSSKTFWPPPPASLIAAGVSGAGVIVGIVFTAIRHGNADDRRAFRTQHPGVICGPGGSAASETCTRWNDLLDAESQSKTIANVAFGVGIGAAVVAVGTWFLFPRVTTQAQVKPVFAPGQAGVELGGRF